MGGLTVAVVVGPGDLPEGWDVACRRWAGDLDLALRIDRADGAFALAEGLRVAAGVADAVLLASGTWAGSHEVAAAVDEVQARHRTPVVHVDTRTAPHPVGPVRSACSRAIHGRGRRSFQWALRHLVAQHRRPAIEAVYGPEPAQVGDLRVPDGDGPHPVAVLLHGGFWLDPWGRDLMDALAVDLTDAGWATWNVEYRRLGPTGGGFPASFEDAAAAIGHLDELARAQPIDPTRVTLVGHSAGGTLAVWTAATRGQRDGPPIDRLMLLAGVLDLAAAARDDLGIGSVRVLLGHPEDHPDTVARASPVELLPVGVPTLLVHGTADGHVPPGQSQRYAEVGRAMGDPVELVEVDDADHFALIDPRSPAGHAVVARLAP